MPSPYEPSLSEPDFAPARTLFLGLTLHSDSELVPDNYTLASSSEPSPARIAAVASSYFPSTGFS